MSLETTDRKKNRGMCRARSPLPLL